MTVNALINKLTETFAPYIIKKTKKGLLKAKEMLSRNEKPNNNEVEKQKKLLDEFAVCIYSQITDKTV